ncbi:MAG: YqgE/AlgH family protein [Bacteroidetes bacterium]|nr:YqgE/AlgH family protein [Bacteroidota bacterium]
MSPRKITIPKVGNFLISEPFNPEPNFKRSVILISQHNPLGSIGFILNKPTQLKVDEALDDFPVFDSPVYWGGTLQLDSIYYIHCIEELEGKKKIAEGIYWGGNYSQLKVMIESKQVDTTHVKFIAGFSAWEPHVLEEQIKLNNWWLTKADRETTFLEEPKELWGTILQRLGHIYGIMNDFPEDPGVN